MEKLLEIAKSLVGEFDLGENSSAASVAAALITVDGNIYSGVCLDFPCGLGFCAEHSAIAEMIKNRERVITAIVAVDKEGVRPPCGRCRELMVQVSEDNYSTDVLLENSEVRTVQSLLPKV